MDRGGRRKERHRDSSLCRSCVSIQSDPKPRRPEDVNGWTPVGSAAITFKSEHLTWRVRGQDPSGLGGGVKAERRRNQTFRGTIAGQHADDSGTGEVWPSKLVIYSGRTTSRSCSYCLAITHLVDDKSRIYVNHPDEKSFCGSSVMQLHTLPKHYSCLIPKILNPLWSIGASLGPSTHALAHRLRSRTWECSSKHQDFTVWLRWPWPLTSDFCKWNHLFVSLCCVLL